MKWKTLRRETGLIEHVCEHGTGHPNAGSIEFMTYAYRMDKDDLKIPSTPAAKSTWGIHGCDGCCSRKDFPGTAVGAINHTIKRYVAEKPELLERLKHDHYMLWWGILAAMNEAKGLKEEPIARKVL